MNASFFRPAFLKQRVLSCFEDAVVFCTDFLYNVPFPFLTQLRSYVKICFSCHIK